LDPIREKERAREQAFVVVRTEPGKVHDLEGLKVDPALHDALIGNMKGGPPIIDPRAFENPALTGGATALERKRKRIEELHAEIAALGGVSRCREDDTEEALLWQRNVLMADKLTKRSENDATQLSIGLDGHSGPGEEVDRYEREQWVVAANPGSGTGVLLAGIAAARGGSIDDVRASGQAGNEIEGTLGGVGHVLNAARGATAVRAGSIGRVDEFNAAGKLKTKPLIDWFQPRPGKLAENEHGNTIWPNQRVTYLKSAAERAPYKIEVRDVEINGRLEKRLVDAEGRLFDTRDAKTHWSSQTGATRAIFVMNARGELYASKFQESGHFHHSSLAGGQPVAAAGEMLVIEGRLVDISNMSGHYQPSGAHTDQALEVLRRTGLNVSGVEVLDVANRVKRKIP